MDAITVPSTFVELAGRLLLAVLIGAAAGINREWRHKPAGLRTHALVGLGTALAAIIGLMVAGAPGGGEGTTSRVIQGVFAGIGFIGGGVILHHPDPQDTRAVHGLTTAALIWVVAGAGLAAGLGLWRSAVTTIALAWVVLVAGHVVEQRLHAMRPDANERKR
jgi:putative Mg2+ transporter-C (MgtC) family protein